MEINSAINTKRDPQPDYKLTNSLEVALGQSVTRKLNKVTKKEFDRG